MSKNQALQSKRFVVRQSLIGQNQVIEVTFKNGNTVTYNHDRAYELMRANLENLPCWLKFKSYTASGNIPKVLRDQDIL